MLSKIKFTKFLFINSLVILILLFTLGYTGKKNIKPPVAKIIPKVDTLHNEVRIDNYYWLRERDNPEVIKYIEDENKYTEIMMKHTEKLQEKLYKEFISRIKETDTSAYQKVDGYYYYSRTEKKKEYPIYCRKKILSSKNIGNEEVILDVNALAIGHNYLEIGAYKISPNHEFLAYSVDTTGAEEYTLYIKDLKSGKLLKDEIQNTYHDENGVEWANDNETIFYITKDTAKRPCKVFRHKLGNNPEQDTLVYYEKEVSYSLSLYKTKSKRYIFINSGNETTNGILYLDANNPTGEFKIFYPHQKNIQYFLYHHNNKFYILTNENAINFKLMETHLDSISKENWKEVISHKDSIKINDIEIFKKHLVVYERFGGLKRIHIIPLSADSISHLILDKGFYVEFPEKVYSYWESSNPEFDTNILRFTYTSLITPPSVFDYDMDNRTFDLKKREEVLGGYDPSHYYSERVYAEAQDGTKVPISLVYKKGIAKNGNNPLYLEGYGAYGSTEDPSFSFSRLSLLNRGFIYAIAHIRGGGEMGRQWYEDGKLLKKKNTFTDFIACAEYLISEGYTSKDKLVISGGSAGGLLIGAVINMRPDLFKVVIADVPFVDVINTMSDPSIPLTTLEYDEWGNPENKEYYDYMKSYSPYDNVEAKDYPNMLVLAGLNDPRVGYWEPAKWVAKLRAMKTDKNILLLKTNMGGGHFGESGLYGGFRDVAFEYAFIFDILGIK